MTYRKLAIIATVCTALGVATILVLALGSNAGDDHPGGSCGWLTPNPPEPEPAPDEEPGSTSSSADGSGTGV